MAGVEDEASGPAKRTRLDPGQRREQIVDAAERVFEGHDPSEVTFEQVAEEAHVSRALVYNYFGDRGGLIAAVYLRCFERLDVALLGAFATNRSGQDQLRAIIAVYLDFANDHASVCQLISAAEANMHPLIQNARRQRYERMATHWDNTPEGRLLARVIVSMLEGAVLDWLDGPMCDRARTEDVLFALLWSGLSGLGDHGISLPR